MMKRLIGLILLLALLSTAFAEGFSFEEAITWETTVEEAMTYLGEGAASRREAWSEHASVTIVGKDNAQCLGLDCARLRLIFFNDRLCAISGYFTAENLSGDIQPLIDALSARYGEPEYPDPHVMTLGDLLNQITGNGSKTVCTWQPDDDTAIDLTDTSDYQDADGEAYPYAAYFGIINGPVYDDMNDAVDQLMDIVD